MSFVGSAYLIFLPAVLAIYWAMPSRRLQNVVLVLASAVFYGWVHPWFLALLYASCLLDWGAGLAIARYPARRDLALAASVAGNLGLLGTFKYFDFFAGSVQAALASLGMHASVPMLELFLPAGISFYTFQTMSYTLDVWRGRIAPRASLLDVVVFVSLFPQLVAGPVERARDLMPQVERLRVFDAERTASGLGLCLRGAVAKVVVADNLGLYVDRVFALERPAFPLVWGATLAFAVQILADFGGYTLIARGSARMLGFELVENFRAPYLAATPSEFWRRWHVSFSSWIHEYLYVPLRGPAPSPARRTAATFGSMLASGLWHGASWNFVLWGGYHAGLLSAHRAWRAVAPRPLPRLAAVPLMFAATLAGWLLFREQDLGRLLGHLARSPLAATRAEWSVGGALLAVALAGGGLLRLSTVLRVPADRHAALLRGVGWGAAAVAVFLFSRDTSRDFLYFRF